MISEIGHVVFAHVIANPPSLQRHSSIDLTLTNSKGRVRLVKVGEGLQTKYSLTVTDPSSLGLPSFGRRNVELFIGDVVLACNLALRQTALSTIKYAPSQADVKYQRPRKVTVENRPEGQHITFTDTHHRNESVYFAQPFSEAIDEDQILSNLMLVNKTDRHRLSTDHKMELVNLVKSLGEFENAMSVFDRLAIFKHLFNSLELATNWDGKDRRGKTFDVEAANLSSVPESDISVWRDFYNRTKHVDSTSDDTTKFVKGIENLPDILMPLRSATEAGIIKRLNSI